MAEEKSNKKPKRRACAQTRKNLKRSEWYYRDGEYFLNKRAFQEWKAAKIAKEAEAAAESKA